MIASAFVVNKTFCNQDKFIKFLKVNWQIKSSTKILICFTIAGRLIWSFIKQHHAFQIFQLQMDCDKYCCLLKCYRSLLSHINRLPYLSSLFSEGNEVSFYIINHTNNWGCNSITLCMLLFHLINLDWHSIVPVVPALPFTEVHWMGPLVITWCSELLR